MFVDLRDILLNCVHPALAQLVEQDDDQSRSIYRIKCIFKELSKTKQLTKGTIDELGGVIIISHAQEAIFRLDLKFILFCRTI